MRPLDLTKTEDFLMTLTDPGLVISFLAKKTSSQQHDDYYTAYTLPFTRRFLAWFSAGQHAYYHQPTETL